MTLEKLYGSAKDTYLILIRQFPLRPIRSEKELDKAISVIDVLVDKESLTQPEEDYLDVLSNLVHDYETEEHPLPSVSDAEMLRFLMENHGVTQAKLAQETQIAVSTLSEILAEKRRLNRSHIARLSRYFHVEPGVFMF
jgi:HTH-type transcriptional regulator/antitoxin HigA